MRSLLSVAAAVIVVALASTASAEPGCDTPCATDFPPTPTKMRSVPVFVTGVVFDVVGAAAAAAGVGIVVASHDCGPCACCAVTGTVVDLVGIAAMAGGAIFLAIGIPLTAVGATSVPDLPAKSGRGSGSGLVWTF